MDFRRVEPRFKRYACLLQTLALRILLIQAAYRLVEILRHAGDPIIAVSMGAGMAQADGCFVAVQALPCMELEWGFRMQVTASNSML